MAAEALLERFHEKAQIIRAWGDLRDPDQAGRMIIDCNMNLPLLYWASEQTGDPRFANAAKAHVAQAAKYLIRQMRRPSTPTIWTCKPAHRVTVIRSRAMLMILAGRVGRHGDLWFSAELYLHWRYTNGAAVEKAGQLLS